MSSDNYTGIFDHLTPDDFDVETTAIDEVHHDSVGVERFNSFIDEQVRAVRISFTAADGEVNPIAILASPTTQRIFTPDDEETLGEFITRVKRESRLIKATWVFFSMRTEVATYKDVEARDVDDVTALEEHGDTKEGIFWYGERSEGEYHMRHGIMPMVEGSTNKLGPVQEAAEGARVKALEGILG